MDTFQKRKIKNCKKEISLQTVKRNKTIQLINLNTAFEIKK